MLKAIKNYLEQLDEEQKPLASSGEHDIAQKIKDFLKKDKNYEPTKEDNAEMMAFDFMAEYVNDDFGWGTYYGPLSVLPNSKGQMAVYPSIRQIDQEMLEYWAKRAKESKSPILLSRYADLVVVFSPKIVNKQADIDLFQIVIDSNITICKKSLANPPNCEIKAKRALELALYKYDQEQIKRAKEVLISLGLWNFIFKMLLLDFPEQATLEDIEKKELVDELEKELKRVERNPRLAENVISLLAEYYRGEKDEKNLMRVLSVLENSLKTNDRLNSDALLKTHAYERIHEIYREYGRHFPEAKKASTQLSKEIGQLDLDWDKSLQKIPIEEKIEQEDIKNYLKGIFGEKKDDGLEMIMAKIAMSHLPKKDAVKNQLDDVSNKYPLQFLCTKQVISDDGVLIAKLPKLEEDYDNHFQSYALQYVKLGSFFLSLTMDELRKQFSKENVVKYFEKSVVFKNEDKNYLKRAISAYWDQDYLVSSHLFNPLIESGIRELIKNCDGLILIPNDKLNGYKNVLLGGLLRNDKIFEGVFSQSGHNVLFYFKLVLTERLGMNLRNDFAHGLGKQKFFGRDASDRLFHILIWLSRVKKKEK